MQKYIRRYTIPTFCSDTLLSCSDSFSSCSEAFFNWPETMASCSDWLRTYSDIAASFSVRTPFWYSRSRALDSTRSCSRRALWIFLSERFIASLSFSFSSAWGSICFISWRCCSATRVISCKCTMTVSLSNSKNQPGPSQM